MRRFLKEADVASVELTDAQLTPSSYGATLIVARHRGIVAGHLWNSPRFGVDPADVARVRRLVGGLEAEWRLLRRSIGRGDDASKDSSVPVAVVVTTRDRERQLSRCLDSLMRLAPRASEIVVVATGASERPVRELCAGTSVEVISAAGIGASGARNRGAAATGAPLIAFLDDDCVVEPEWLATVPGAFHRDERLAAITGYVGPLHLRTPAQALFEGHEGFQASFERWSVEGPATGPLLTLRLGSGNSVVRRDEFEHVGGFSELLGPGTPTRALEDADFHFKLLRVGGRITWDPGLIAWHEHRGSRRALRQMLVGYAIGSSAFAARCLAEFGDPRALAIWRGYLRHVLMDCRRWLSGYPRAVGPDVFMGEVLGLLYGPAALAISRARSGLAEGQFGAAVPRNPSREDSLESNPTVGASASGIVNVDPSDPTISVVVVSRNRAALLARVLEALGAQTYPAHRFEVLVVLDGSTDKSAEAVRSCPEHHRVRLVEQEHKGVAAARNRGIADAREPVILFIDDDVIPSPELVAAHARAHRDAQGEIAALGPCIPRRQTGSLLEAAHRAWWLDHYRRKAESRHVWTFVDFVDGNTSLPRALFGRLGGFDEGLRRAQDYELGCRLIEAGTEMRFLADARAEHWLDSDLDLTRRRAREEGAAHVALARRHPHTLAHLPLGRSSRDRPWRDRAVAGLGAVANTVDTRRFDGLERIVSAVVGASYRQGVRDAGGDDLLGSTHSPDGPPLVIDLGDRQPLVVSNGERATRVSIEFRGGPVAEVEAFDASGQWSWSDLAARVNAAVREGNASSAEPLLADVLADAGAALVSRV